MDGSAEIGLDDIVWRAVATGMNARLRGGLDQQIEVASEAIEIALVANISMDKSDAEVVEFFIG